MPHDKPWSSWITDKEISLISLQEVQRYMKCLYTKCFWLHVWHHCVPYRCFFRYSTCSPFVDRTIEFHSKWGICRTESWKVSVNIAKIRVGEQLYIQENLHSWASVTQMFLCWWLWVISGHWSPLSQHCHCSTQAESISHLAAAGTVHHSRRMPSIFF